MAQQNNGTRVALMTLTPFAARRLLTRAPLPLNPAHSIAIKRNVHEFLVAAPAERFAEAFRSVLREPGATFGLLQLKRQIGRQGLDFVLGERFQAGFSMSQLARGGPRWARWMAQSGPARLAEELLLSDYAEVCEVAPLSVAYRYLKGSPIAGQSWFEVTPNAADQCTLRATFVFQEVAGWAIPVMHRFAARVHDEVTVMQVRRAAAEAGGRVVSATTRTGKD